MDLTLPVGARDHVRGLIDAPVTLLEYGDFECPQCGEAYAIVKAMERRFGERLRFVFRNFPLTNVHPDAQRAAEAAEWAASVGAFWPMHDALFEARQQLSEVQILAVTRRLGLDPRSLETAWETRAFFRRVKEDFRSGIDSGLEGTPGFFIDGLRHAGAWDADALARAIERAL
jgi:protein-disulfide isomerase